MSGPGIPDEELVSAELDGELTDAERARLDDALRDSPRLRDARRELAFVRDALRGLPVREAPPGLWASLGVPEPASASADEVSALRSRRRPGRLAVFLGGAAAAAMVVAVVAVPQERESTVRPPVQHFTEAHSERSATGSEPVSGAAPAAVPTGLGP